MSALLREQPATLRHALRTGTRPEHDLTEAAFERFDLATEAGHAGYLAAQRSALQRLSPSFRSVPWLEDEISRLLHLAQADLFALGARARPLETGDAVKVHPLAAGYVVLGSRLGAAVLLQRVIAATGAAPMATRYLGDRLALTSWARLCTHLTGQAEEGESVLADVRRVFQVFREQAGALNLPRPHHSAASSLRSAPKALAGQGALA